MAKPACIICWSKLSKRERKLLDASRRAIIDGRAVLTICSTCTAARMAVAAKMKRSY